MKYKVLLFCSLLLLGFQDIVQESQGTINFASNKQVEVNLRVKGQDTQPRKIKGDLAYFITKVNDDDSIIGTLMFASDNTSKIIQRDVHAKLKKGTFCPILKIVLPKIDLESRDSIIELEHILLQRETGQTDLDQMFCAFTRQINTHKERIGLIAAINRIIAPN